MKVVRAESTGERVTVETDDLRVEWFRERGRYEERVSVHTQSGWRRLTHALDERPATEDYVCSRPIVQVEFAERTRQRAVVHLTAEAHTHDFHIEVTIDASTPWIHYAVRYEVPQTATIRCLQRIYEFEANDVDFSFAPYLRPKPDHIIGQHAFRSPALILQKDALMVALVPDLNRYPAHSREIPYALHLDLHPGRREFGFGIRPHTPEGLLYFKADKGVPVPARSSLGFSYYLYATGAAEPGRGYRLVVDFLWKQFGRRWFHQMVEQVASIETYADYTQHYVESVLWTELGELGAGPAGCIPMGIKFSNDVWFHFLFNQLYTAFGMHRLGKLLDKPGLVDKAEKIKNLILSSPRKGGFFHTIYSFDVVTGYRVARWIPSSGWLPGRISYGTYVDRPEESPRFHLPDCSWTAYWMVRWYAGLEQDERLLNFATEYAEHLLKVQMPSGAFPTFLDAESMEIEPQLMETAGSAASALFLVELYRATQDPRYLGAAERTAAFLKFEVIPQRRWQDFEYANDSLAKPAEMYDRFTRQHPQTTMPIFWASELFRTLAAVSKPGPRRDAYMEEALGLVDYLCLYQQVWSPPFLSLACFGGFVVGNGHPAWSDARQGFFPQALTEYYGETGRIEFLERAVAAMRATLPLAFMPENREVSPVWNCGPEGHADENYGHRGQDRRAVPHSIDFGIGYALVSYAFLADRFGDLHVDLRRRTAIGINGLVIVEQMITSEAVTLEVRGVQLGERRLRMKISGCTGGKPLTLEINGKVFRCRPSTENHEQIIQLDT